ncbi:MAG: class I mannose-6-phosphate isomerase [Clostridia bacterium]|nr:class I mannose-6-phosphate isomerase [Clostridia bacterium]
MNKLYPLLLSGITKSPIWGGTRLPLEWNKTAPNGGTVGESWELTVRQKEMCTVKNGALAGRTVGEILRERPCDLMGASTLSNGEFPLLIKFIDAADKLSVQVHPDDTYAARVEGDRGKTEMWYIVDADEDAEIICGLADGIDNAAFCASLQKGDMMSTLKVQKVHRGETYFIPAGLPHAIGKGILIAEIQQNCDLTYRVYDYERRGADGSLRELHIEKACDVIRPFTNEEIDTIRYSRGIPASREDVLADCAYFRTEKLNLSQNAHTLQKNNYLRHLMCVGGEGELTTDGISYSFRAGDSILLPACLNDLTVKGNGTVLISTAY